MSDAVTRRSILRISGGLGVAGIVGFAGVQPASAADDPAAARLLAMRIQAMQIVATNLHLSNIGYDESQRWSFLDKKNRRIIPNTECDCSSSCGGIAWLAGFPVDISGTFYTGNFATKMAEAGFKKIAFSKLSQVKTGDFLVGPGHAIFCVDTGKTWWSAEHGETKETRTSGGTAGDQTGTECVFRAPYIRDDGWTYILRPQ